MRLCKWSITDESAVGKVAECETRPHFSKQPEEAILLQMGSNILHTPTVVPSEMLAEYRTHCVWNLQWQNIALRLHKSLAQKQGTVFNISEVSSPASPGSPRTSDESRTLSPEVVAIAVLRMQVKSSTVCLAGAFSPLESIYDAFNPVFDDIVSLAEEIHSSYAGGYHFDFGIIPPLHITAMKCRHRTIRRRAISLLATTPFKEGVFDSTCCYQIATWFMGVEEDGVETEVIPEHRRLSTKESSLDMPRRRVHLQATNRKNAEDTELQWHETTIQW